MELAFEFIKAKGGLTTESNYPYKAADGTCDVSKVISSLTTSVLINCGVIDNI